jgi:hypothetical protein
MARSFATYALPSLASAEYRSTNTWMGARLYELAWMTQGVVDVSAGGPEWTFLREGEEVSTKPALTLSYSDGSTGYWNALQRRWKGEYPDWVEVQEFHAKRQGATTWLLTDEFIVDNPVEFTNRTDAYYFLSHARGWDSREVETAVLMAVHPTALTLDELAKQLGRPVHHVQAASLRLWRRRLLQLPMATAPMGPSWLVAGARHGLA